MRIALLICDQVNEDLRHIQGDYPNMFRELFPELEMEIFEVYKNVFPKNVNDFDAYLVNGSRRSVYENIDWINRLKSFVREIYINNKKMVGVCFGHQLLAEALGGKVAKSKNGWCVGVHEFEILKKEKWMSPFQNKINLLMMCQDQVILLPKNSEVLAATNKCPIAIFQVEKNMLGIQAHPEFSKDYDRALMELRIERMGKYLVEEGIKNLDKNVNKKTIKDWIINFLHD